MIYQLCILNCETHITMLSSTSGQINPWLWIFTKPFMASAITCLIPSDAVNACTALCIPELTKEVTEYVKDDKGRIQETAVYQTINGIRHGNYSLFDRSKKLKQTSTYYNGVIEGNNRKNGGLIVENFEQGKLHGKQIYRYKSQKIKQIVHYKHGLKHGVEENYRPDGTLESRNNYVNDCMKDAYLVSTVQLTTGKTALMVNTIEYLPTPEIKNGWNNKIKHGWEREYRDDELISEIRWYNNERHGYQYHKRDENIEISWYYHGKYMDDLWRHYENGKLRDRKDLLPGNMTRIQYYWPSGHKKQDYGIANNMYETRYRKFRSWFENGQLEERCHYDENGDRIGVETKWDENGKVISRVMYNKGVAESI